MSENESSGSVVPLRPEGMSTKQRQFKFDRGDWIALRVRDEWKLVGKVRDADSESITVRDRNDCDRHFVPGEDPADYLPDGEDFFDVPARPAARPIPKGGKS